MKNIAAIMILGVAAAAHPLAAQPAAAQSPAEEGLAVAAKLKTNSEDSQHYTYKRRTEVQFKDKTRVRLELVRYVNGRMETVALDNPDNQAQSGSGRGRRRGMLGQNGANKQREELKEEVQQLTGLFRSYTSPGAEATRSMFAKAVISREGPPSDTQVRFAATGVVKPADSVMWLWSIAHQRPDKIEVHTDLDGRPVSMTINFAQAASGPFYPAHVTVQEPKKDLTVNIDQFELMPAAQ